MNRLIKSFIVLLFIIASCSNNNSGGTLYVTISTTLGNIKVKLYNETPLHRDNFIKLVRSGAYDNLLFHRVIEGFMIQGGDPDTRFPSDTSFSDTLSSYTIPAEINPLLFHKKGALAAARMNNDVNPEMRSSGMQFYIVQGKIQTDEDLFKAEERINANIKQAMLFQIMREYSDSSLSKGGKLTDPEIQERAFLTLSDIMEKKGTYTIADVQKEIYRTTGGTPRLDATYTVFGEVTEGLETVDRIAAVKTGEKDKPVDDIRILKMKITRK
jgi:peptidyl-prolyl cis-trans isomerase B (cyclophilin B)